MRGFADQRLRKKDNPLDASNRRISLIAQYLDKPANSADKIEGEHGKEDAKGPAAEPAKAAEKRE